MFADRAEAGVLLADKLGEYRAAADAADAAGGADVAGAAAERVPLLPPLVLGIPRGGVVVAAEVACALGLPLDVAVAAKVGAPGNEEYAVGAVAADGVVNASPVGGYSAEEVALMAGPARQKVAHELAAFRPNLLPIALSGRTVILVDDGLATGLTALAAVDWLRRQGAGRVVVAVPVASESAARDLAAAADELVVLETPPGFSAVGEFYGRFGPTGDDEVLALLDEARTIS